MPCLVRSTASSESFVEQLPLFGRRKADDIVVLVPPVGAPRSGVIAGERCFDALFTVRLHNIMLLIRYGGFSQIRAGSQTCEHFEICLDGGRNIASVKAE